MRFKFFLILLLFLTQFALSVELVQTYSENNKFGLIQDNKKITEAKYSKLIRLKDSSWLCLYKNKYGIISNSGEILVEPKYTNAKRLASRFVKMSKGSKTALFNENGQMIIAPEYDSINLLYGQMFLVQKKYKFGLISFDGDILLAPVMDDIYMPKPNIIKLSYNGEWYEIRQEKRETIEIPNDIIELMSDSETKILNSFVQNPIATTGYGIVNSGDYAIKLFSSISPTYEQTIDELVLNNGADAVSILMKCSWLLKFPYVYARNYINNIKTPNNGPLSDVKNNLKNKIK